MLLGMDATLRHDCRLLSCLGTPQPVKPKLEMEVPYRTYSLVYSDGTPVPRKSKHAFALTIVRYDSKCNEKEIWCDARSP